MYGKLTGKNTQNRLRSEKSKKKIFKKIQKPPLEKCRIL